MAKEKRRRSFSDRSVTTLNSLRFSVSEPIVLRRNRRIHGSEYEEKEHEPLISVYIPTYNRCKILMERAIPTVLNQTYMNFELLVIGDHCTDETEKEVTSIDDPRIRFYQIPKRGYRYPPTVENHWFAGPVVAANQALSMVRGKWIARIDDDDTWTEDHLKALLEFAQRRDYEFVSAMYEAERNGKRLVVDVKDENPRIGGTQTWLYRSYLKSFGYNIDCWRKAWNRVNDIDLQVRMYRAGVRMGFLERVVAYVLPRPGESTIGLDAYKNTSEEKGKHFRFEK